MNLSQLTLHDLTVYRPDIVETIILGEQSGPPTPKGQTTLEDMLMYKSKVENTQNPSARMLTTLSRKFVKAMIYAGHYPIDQIDFRFIPSGFGYVLVWSNPAPESYEGSEIQKIMEGSK